MHYLLDTCVIGDFIKGESGTQIRLKQTPRTAVAVSDITAPHGIEWNNRGGFGGDDRSC